jgi:hypothetical protein
MLKLLIVLPMLLLGMALLGAGALVFLPLIAVFPIVLAMGAVMFAFVFAMGIFAFVFRLIGALVVGAGALAVGAIGLAFVLAGGAAVLGITLVFAHLLLPLLVIVGIVRLIQRAGKPSYAPPIAHG